MLTEIRNDVFGIVDRIKSIDGEYRVYYDGDERKFCLYHRKDRLLNFPYRELDERAVAYVVKTRRENIEQLLEEIDRNNEKIRIDGLKHARDKFEDEVSYALRHI